MDRHIDLDTAMVMHLKDLGYTVTEPGGTAEPSELKPEEFPSLIHAALARLSNADRKYADAWDCLSSTSLAEIIQMKAGRVLAGLDNDNQDVVIDSLVDIVNYACKLYKEYTEQEG